MKVVRKAARAAAGAGALLAGATSLPAQTLEDLRDELRAGLREIHFAQDLLGLVLLSDELELSGAQYAIDDESGTDLTVYALPFHSTLPLADHGGPRLHLEGALGYAVAHQEADDIYGGLIPALATSVKSRWTTYGALLGAGLEFDLAKDLTLAPIVDVGLARLENDSVYGGPGAGFTAALADGIAFNWDALAATYGAAGRLDWQHALGPHHRLDLVGRYDMRWTETVQTDDEAQDFVARSQLITLRGDLTGPLGIRLCGDPVEWQLTAAYRAFPEGTLFGVEQYGEIGGSLLVHDTDHLPLGEGFALSAAAMFGEDLRGWTVGFKVLF